MGSLGQDSLQRRMTQFIAIESLFQSRNHRTIEIVRRGLAEKRLLLVVIPKFGRHRHDFVCL